MKLNKTLLAALAAVMMAGCQPNISPNVDQAVNANTVQRTVSGTVVSMRNITVKDGNNKLGMLAGAGTGAIAGSAIGGGDRMHLINGIGGALIGGLAGNYAQDKLSTQTGVEYVVKTDKSGGLITVVQSGANSGISIGQHVFVVMGPHARVVAA